jgi:hypothetical protein
VVTRGQRVRLTNPRIETDTERRWAPRLASPFMKLILGASSVTEIMRLTRVR